MNEYFKEMFPNYDVDQNGNVYKGGIINNIKDSRNSVG